MRKLIVSFGGANPAKITHVKELTWKQFALWLTKPVPVAKDKAERGWYLPAEFDPAYRDSDNFVARHAITFDFDKVDLDTEAKVKEVWKDLTYALYTTFSHTEEKPRFRVVMPLSRPAAYDEYQAVVRKVAQDIGIEYVAAESFVPAQMMYSPTCAVEGTGHSYAHAGAWLDVDGVLAEYENWTDQSQWPRRADGDNVHAIASEITPPDQKPGVIGQFCRAFTIPDAISRFDLPYVPTANPGRYTYTAGSRPEGAIVYDNGLKFHSHHGSDPARGQVSAFDLVRLHKFKSLDEGTGREVPISERPSFKAMVRFALDQPELQEACAGEEFQDLGPLVEEELIVSKDSATPDRFRVISAEEFSGGKPAEWIVKGVLPRAEICVIYGESGSGKSFLTLDLSAAITRGIVWRDLPVMQGKVVYVIAEGAGGFKKRLRAYSQEHKCELHELPSVIPNAPNLLEAKDVAELTRSILQWGHPDVIIIDTLSATIPGGNENSGEDVGLVLSHCKFIHSKTGALVVLIHHSGKDATRGARGWSGLRAAADAEIEVARNGDFRLASITKQKDGADGEKLSFRLRTVTLPGFEEVETSCVVEHTEEIMPRTEPNRRPQGALQILVFDTLKTMSAGTSVNVEDLTEGVLLKLPKPEGRDTRRGTVLRALTGLVAKGLAFMQSADRVSLIRPVEVEDNSWLE